MGPGPAQSPQSFAPSQLLIPIRYLGSIARSTLYKGLDCLCCKHLELAFKGRQQPSKACLSRSRSASQRLQVRDDSDGWTQASFLCFFSFPNDPILICRYHKEHHERFCRRLHRPQKELRMSCAPSRHSSSPRIRHRYPIRHATIVNALVAKIRTQRKRRYYPTSQQPIISISDP